MKDTRINVDDIDLSRHGTVEASAGTGKTFTIERLVYRLLTEQQIPLDQILVVTFTEKATGELKSRLRAMLEQAAAGSASSILRRSLDQFDQAPIFTIHGFCQRILQEYPLEQGQDFHSELVNDYELLQVMLRDIQRKDWRSHFGAALGLVLEAAGYQRDATDKWVEKVVKIAYKYRPECGHRLRPDFTPDWWRRLDEPGQNWSGQLELFTIDLLQRRAREYKRQRGKHSFDDMIAAVEFSLDRHRHPGADLLLQTLRQRFRYGIVDEFQDTDPLQWAIFGRIFLDSADSRLFVVGDPKQAIFGFRGADLPTYLKAVRDMSDRCLARVYSRNVNWRSEPNLIEALNCVFGDGAWFPEATGIHYEPVHAAAAAERKFALERDDTDRAALTIVDTSSCDTLKGALKRNARFIAAECARLLSPAQGPLLSYARKPAAPRPIDANDIAVLVFKRKEAEPLLQAFEVAGVPYSFYKQAGLWQSDEAIHLEMLLQTLAHPGEPSAFRKALLTCFFRVRPGELARNPDLPLTHPARELYQCWLAYADHRAWSALCQSLVEDTGLLFTPPGDPAADRRLSTMRHLLSMLQQAGHGLNLDLVGLLGWVSARRRFVDQKDEDVHPVEAGRPRVKVMTIHASKGLEFPIVFLAGGFTQALIAKEQCDFRDDENEDALVFDLLADDEARVRMKAQRWHDSQRLLYVALTRAIFKLYVPKPPELSSGYNGPLATVLLPALERACPEKLDTTVVRVIDPMSVQRPTRRPALSLASAAAEPIRLEGPLFAPIDSGLSRRRIQTRSFSSMIKHHLQPIGERSSFGESAPKPEDETATPLDQEDPLRGPVFGDMVHNVLEKIRFDEVGRAGQPEALIRPGAHARKQIDEQIRASAALLRSRTPVELLDEACRQQIASLVWHALKTPLAELGAPLCSIPDSDRLCEVEFLYPEREREPAESRFITGFIDLLFRHRGRYYLLDWKTNLLPGYERNALERSMIESDYRCQYRLYLQALHRWLARMERMEGDVLDRLGGVYYLYVRGMNGKDDSTGVYFHRPTPDELELSNILKA